MMDEGKRNEKGSGRGMNFIDLAVRQSSAELKRIVKYYKQIGRNEEARKIDETIDRLERQEAKDQGSTDKRQDS